MTVSARTCTGVILIKVVHGSNLFSLVIISHHCDTLVQGVHGSDLFSLVIISRSLCHSGPGGPW